MDKKFNREDILLCLFGSFIILLFVLFCKFQISEDIFSLGENFKWVSIFYFFGFALLLYVFVYGKTEYSKIIALILILIFIIFSYPLFSPYNTIYDRDSSYALQDMSTTIESTYHSDINISGYATEYNALYGFSFTNIIISLLTGIPLEITLLFVPFLITFLGLSLVLYLLLKKLFPKAFVLFGVLLFFIAPRLNHIHYESLGWVFLFFCFFALYQTHIKKMEYHLPLVIFSLCTFLTHHLTSYILIFVLVTYLFIKTKQKLFLVLFTGIFITLFFLFFQEMVLSNLYNYSIIFLEVINQLFSSFSSLENYLNLAYVGFNFNILEILAIFLSFCLYISLLFFGLNNKEKLKSHYFFMIIISTVLSIFFGTFLFTKGIIIFLREIPLLLFGYFVLISIPFLDLIKQNKKKILFCILLILLIGGNLLSYGSQQRRLFVDEESISINSDLLITNEFISAGFWANDYIDYANTVIGSDLIFNTIGPYGHKNVERFAKYEIPYIYFEEDIQNEEIREDLLSKNYTYIYFESLLLDYKNTFSENPLSEESLSDLEDCNFLNKVYSTKNINLFNVI